MGKGKTVTKQDAALIWETYLNGSKGEAKRLCERLGYHKSTFYNIINNEGEVNDTIYSIEKKWNPEQIDACIGYIENINPQVTLQDLRDIFVSKYNFPDIALSTLWNYLDGELITVKLITQYNQMRNTIFNKYKRLQYSNWFLSNQGRNFFFVDETGFNLNTTRRVARAERGHKAIVQYAQSNGTNISVCACVNKDIGLVYSNFKCGSYKCDDFISFLNEMNYAIWNLNIQNPTLVMDNCKMHVENEIAQWAQETGWDFIYLPPYSPMLNPIEECFSVLKNQIKKLLTGDFKQMRMNIAYLPWGEKTIQRINLLGRVIQRSLPSITQPIVQNCYNHMMLYLPQCILLQDM